MPGNKKNTIFTAVAIFAGTSILANLFAMFAMGPVYKMIRSADDWILTAKVLEGTEALIPLTFIIPIILAAWYLFPVYYQIYNSSKNINAAISDISRRRIINSPLITSLISIVGWVVMSVVFVIIMFIGGMKIPARIPVRFTIEMVLIGILCFVICYYMLEYLVRRFLILHFFPDNRLSDVKNTLRLSIRSRFFIYFFAVSFFPLLLFYSIFFVREGFSGLSFDMAIICVEVLILGIFLTLIFSRSYQHPLIEMKKAARFIQHGNYDIRMNVLSNDEVGLLCEGMNSMSAGLKEKEFIKDTFGKIVDPRVRDFLLQGNVELGGEIKEVTILFSDIRSFTSASEKMRPDMVVAWLNRYFDRMSRCITEEKGLVNKYIGDAIMAIFGAPVYQEDHADAAVRAAQKMLKVLDDLNRDFSAENFPAIKIGIGIHTGQVLAGNIGSSDRMEYTVIGDAVNVASRLESLTKEHGKPVLLSESTSRALKNRYDLSCLSNISIRGKEEPMNLFYCEME